MKLFLCTIFFVFSSFIIFTCAQDADEDIDEPHGADEHITRTQEYLFSQIFSNYSNRVRPCGPATGTELKDACGPTEIQVFVFLRTVDDVSDKDMNFDLQLIFRQTWLDPRLAYRKIPTDYMPQWLTLGAEEKQYKVWLPDTFFANEKRGFTHAIDKDNIMLRISPDGNVTYSFRATVTLHCQMDFRYFPRDKHRCAMDVSSYAHTVQHIVYKWREHNSVLMNKGFKENVINYNLERIKREDCSIVTTTGEYGCVRLSIQFRRIFSFSHFGQMFLPTFVLVCVSWLSFWLGTEAIITRASFGLLCFITLIIHTAILANKFPPVSSIRSIDIWLTICLAFLIGVLLQLVIIYRITRQTKKREEANRPIQYVIPTLVELEPERKKTTKSQRSVQISEAYQTPLLNEPTARKTSEDTAIRYTQPNVVIRKWRRCTRAQKFDVICRALFPIAFFLINIAFWGTQYSK